MWIVLYRTADSKKGTWIESDMLRPETEEDALKKYAMRVKEYGKENVLLVETLALTCVSVEVLYDSVSGPITVNSQ